MSDTQLPNLFGLADPSVATLVARLRSIAWAVTSSPAQTNVQTRPGPELSRAEVVL